jgi:hypothetical protein
MDAMKRVRRNVMLEEDAIEAEDCQETGRD